METFLITGANHGLGFELVLELTSRPNAFVIAAVHLGATQDLLNITSQNPDRVMITQMDVGNPNSILGAAAEVSAKIPQLDVLINNAATQPAVEQQSFEAVTRDQIVEVFQINAMVDFINGTEKFIRGNL